MTLTDLISLLSLLLTAIMLGMEIGKKRMKSSKENDRPKSNT